MSSNTPSRMWSYTVGIRSRLAEQRKAVGYTQEGLAEALGIDRRTVQRWEAGTAVPEPLQRPRLAKALAVSAKELTELLTDAVPVKPLPVDADIAHVKESAMNLLNHADKHGGDLVAPAAVQVWRSAQRKLDAGLISDKALRPYLASVAELAEIAGWLLFEAGQWDAARSAFMESHIMARHAGDDSMRWFALDMLAMLAIERERPYEALRIADELLCGTRVPPRVVSLAQMRRGRALAQVGDRKRSLTNMAQARGRVEESLNPRDPGWTWWVDATEIQWHTGAALTDLNSYDESTSAIQSALERITVPDGRFALLLRIGLLSAFVKTRAWRDAESELEFINSLLGIVTSGRSRHHLRGALSGIVRDSRTPAWLSDLALDVGRHDQFSGVH
jgi:transcriptional regulator with XRE-family HTH domain